MANYLADRRIELGLTQKDIAQAVGVAEATVSRWESGNIANMRRDRIAAYAKVLQTTPDFIMTGESPQNKTPAQQREVTDDDIKFALFDGGPVTDAQFAEVKQFVRFIKERDANAGKD